MEKFSVIIVEDAKLELKGTEEIFRTELPEADIMALGDVAERFLLAQLDLRN